MPSALFFRRETAKPGISKSSVLRLYASAWIANWPLPTSTTAAPLRWFSAPPKRASARPKIPSTFSVGIRWSIALTTPPTALPPYNRAAGPRTTSICSIMSGSMPTAWSKLKLDASKIPTPFCMILTRSASSPRITGRDAFGPNWVAVTPGIPFSVSPNVPARRRLNSRPFNTVTGTTSSSEPTPKGLPVTATGAKSILVGSCTLMGSCAYVLWINKLENAKNSGLSAKNARTCVGRVRYMVNS